MAWDIIICAAGGKLLALDSATGAVRWENAMEGGGYGEVALAVTGERIFASAERGKLFCLEYPTGAVLWTSPTSTRGRATILVDGGNVYVARLGHLDCFDVESGSHRWSSSMPGSGYGSVSIGVPGNVAQADAEGTNT
jgi:outer membrane protein assembly factor BamB